MKRFCYLLISLLFSLSAFSQGRITDALDSIPVAAASIFDAAGNIVGYSMTDGTFSEIPATAYPITIRCMGYTPLVIKQPKDTTWQMIPSFFDMEELVVVPVKRNILKQTFYVREFFNISNATDTVTYFVERMAYRFVPASKGERSGIGNSVHTLSSRCYSRYKDASTDSVAQDEESKLPPMLILLEHSSKDIVVPESFKTQTDTTRVYEKKGKSGMSLVQKQNNQVFISTEDMLAGEKDHMYSPWPLKLLGMTMEINQLYAIKVFRANEESTYMQKDLMETSFVMEAVGRGKYLRNILNSDEPVSIRSVIEFYVVDSEYFSLKEAKDEKKRKVSKVDFVIPSNAQPLDVATQRMVNRIKKGL